MNECVTYATTFSGIGLWELGLKELGWRLAWQCEINPWARRFLEREYGVPVYDCITRVSDDAERVNVLFGSPPCQPFSNSGEQRGDDDPRSLRRQFVAVVGRIKPDWVVVENVVGLWRLEAEEKLCADLEGIGYQPVTFEIPSCAIGGWSQRARTITVANSNGGRLSGSRGHIEPVHSTPDEDWQTSGIVDAFQRNALPFLCGVHTGNRPRVCEPVNHALGNGIDPRLATLIGRTIESLTP